MPLSTDEKLVVRVQCQDCNQRTDKALSWLRGRVARGQNLPANQSRCGHAIDLRTEENRQLIGRLADIR
jgi:hypothetical protein